VVHTRLYAARADRIYAYAVWREFDCGASQACGWIILGERPSASQLLGCPLLIGAVWAVSVYRVSPPDGRCGSPAERARRVVDQHLFDFGVVESRLDEGVAEYCRHEREPAAAVCAQIIERAHIMAEKNS
jgi:hypothetical protein